MGNIQAHHNTDIPMATQRSDDWPLETVPLGVFGDEQPVTLDRAQRRKLSEALRALDAERQLKGSAALVEKNKAE